MSDAGETPRPTEPDVATTGAANPLTGDWPAQAADAVVDLVGTVRDRAVEPLLTVVRALVYGIVIVVTATIAVVLVIVALIRGLDLLIPGEVWSAYLVLGAIFTLSGMWFWSRRRPRSP
jgi:drug/metabolite transporter (DMT)-like permease